MTRSCPECGAPMPSQSPSGRKMHVRAKCDDCKDDDYRRRCRESNARLRRKRKAEASC